MDWHDEAEAGLPAPDPAEPDGLRRDIVDELADHLDCALDRERARGADEPAAKRAVLQRFGDAGAIARQLWLDAMKERLMSHRVTVTAAALLTAAGFFACFLLWRSLEQNRQLNLAMLAQLQKLADAPATRQDDLAWTSVTIRCVKDKPGGAPAEGFHVALSGNALNPSEAVALESKTDHAGRATFANILPGRYSLRITSSWGQFYDSTVVLLRQPLTTKEVVCPSAAARKAIVDLSVGWPADLNRSNLVICAAFSLMPEEMRRFQEGWKYGEPGFTFLILPDGKLLAASQTGIQVSMPANGIQIVPEFEGKKQQTVSCTPGHYKLNWYTVLSYEPDDKKPLLRRVSVLVRADPIRFPKPEDQRWAGLFNLDPPPEYEAVAGQKNEWKIELPEDLLAEVRNRLAAITPH